MKSIYFLLCILLLLPFSVYAHDIAPIGIDTLECTSTVHERVKHFYIYDLDNEPSASLDASFFEDAITKKNFDFSVSNQCDNMIEFKFKTNDLRKLAQGKYSFVLGFINYESADDVAFSGKIRCTVSK